MRSDHGSSGARSALLSFLLPGLGQLTSGRLRAGIAFLAPVLLLLVLLLLVAADVVGLQELLDPGVMASALAISALLFVWRAAAVLHAYGADDRARRRTRWDFVPWALVVLVVVTQAIPTYTIARMAGTLGRISDDGTSVDDRLLGPMPSADASIEGEGAVKPSRGARRPLPGLLRRHPPHPFPRGPRLPGQSRRPRPRPRPQHRRPTMASRRLTNE